MVTTDRADMSREAFQVAYGGPTDAHSMDVQDLAPALVAFGRLIREANARINGKKAKVRVIVTSDFEHKCFNISFEVLQTILHQVASFFTSEEVKTARQILVDLGIIGGSTGLGLLGFLRWKKDRKVTQIKDSDVQGVVIVQIGAGNVAEVNRNALTLAESPKIRVALEGTLAPLGTENVSRITFKDDRGAEVASYDEADAREIVAAFDLPTIADVPDEEEEPDYITAWLRVYSPVFDEKADKWRVLYGDHPVYADISETSIAKDAITRGGSFVNDLYKVQMGVTQHFTEAGSIRPEYKIIEVLDFRPAPQQSHLLLEREEKSSPLPPPPQKPRGTKPKRRRRKVDDT
ncbi:MAG: hypothetical protein ACRECF_01330 [Methyloceanibacter sp.]